MIGKNYIILSRYYSRPKCFVLGVIMFHNFGFWFLKVPAMAGIFLFKYLNRKTASSDSTMPYRSMNALISSSRMLRKPYSRTTSPFSNRTMTGKFPFTAFSSCTKSGYSTLR